VARTVRRALRTHARALVHENEPTGSRRLESLALEDAHARRGTSSTDEQTVIPERNVNTTEPEERWKKSRMDTMRGASSLCPAGPASIVRAARSPKGEKGEEGIKGGRRNKQQRSEEQEGRVKRKGDHGAGRGGKGGKHGKKNGKTKKKTGGEDLFLFFCFCSFLWPGITFPRFTRDHEVVGRDRRERRESRALASRQRVGVGRHAGTAFRDNCRSGDFFACQTGAQVTRISLDGGYADTWSPPNDALARVPGQSYTRGRRAD